METDFYLFIDSIICVVSYSWLFINITWEIKNEKYNFAISKLFCICTEWHAFTQARILWYILINLLFRNVTWYSVVFHSLFHCGNAAV